MYLNSVQVEVNMAIIAHPHVLGVWLAVWEHQTRRNKNMLPNVAWSPPRFSQERGVCK